MKVLVTGGQGFLGGALVRALAAQGLHEVSATVRRPAPELEALGVRVHCGDLRQRELAFEVTRDQDLIFHTAAKAGVWGPWADYEAINVRATEFLLQGALQHGVRYFVHTSSPSVTFSGRSEIDVDESAPYSERPLNAYCRSKIQAERLVLAAHRSEGLSTLALRPHLIYGPGDPHLLPRVFQAAAKGRLIRIGDGLNRVDITHIQDTVAAHLAVLARCHQEAIWGEPYFITSGSPVYLWDWLAAILEWRGLPPVRRALSLRAAVAVGRVLEFGHRLLPVLGEPRLTHFSALQLGCSHTYSIERARQRLGFTPRIDPYAPFPEQLDGF